MAAGYAVALGGVNLSSALGITSPSNGSLALDDALVVLVVVGISNLWTQGGRKAGIVVAPGDAVPPLASGSRRRPAATKGSDTADHAHRVCVGADGVPPLLRAGLSILRTAS
jgi:hypothetical protein